MDAMELDQNVRRIRELATNVIEKFGPISDVAFGFNRDSVALVDQFIERERGQRDLSAGAPVGLVNTFGAFLGECIIATTGGVWTWNEQQEDYGIVFTSGAQAFPFAKVRKQFIHGRQDSILGFYDVTVNDVAPGKL
jgi:hypothetical protein